MTQQTEQLTEAYAPTRFTLGDFAATVISDGPLYLPASAAAPSALPGDLDRALDEAGLPTDGPLTLDQNILLIDTGDQLVLVDAGSGSGIFPGTGQLPAGHAAAGVDPAAIDLVVITHAHFDHIGGLLRTDGTRAFENAGYVMSRPEHEFWAQDPTFAELYDVDLFVEPLKSVAREVLPAIADQLRLVEFGTEFATGMSLVPAVGHTPGHAAVSISSGGHRLLHFGDLITVPALQLRHTDWVAPVDNWPAHTVASRRRLLDQALEPATLTMASHFPFPGVHQVTTDGTEGGWSWQPVG